MIFFFAIDVTVALQDSLHMVIEGNGVFVCVEVVNGETERQLVVQVSPQNGTAIG